MPHRYKCIHKHLFNKMNRGKGIYSQTCKTHSPRTHTDMTATLRCMTGWHSVHGMWSVESLKTAREKVCVCVCAETSRMRGCRGRKQWVHCQHQEGSSQPLPVGATHLSKVKENPPPPGSSTVTPWPSYLIMLSSSLVTCAHNKVAFPLHFKQTNHSASAHI